MDKVIIFWDGWEPIVRILIVGTLTYIAIISILKISGKRTLARMNAFDFIITITIGSAFGRILTAKEVSLAESITTFILLIGLNYIFSLLESRSRTFKNWVTSQPNMVFYRGEFLEKPMKKERLRKRDLYAAARKSQVVNMEEVEAIILETDGSFSVLLKSPNTEETTFNQLAD